MGKSTEAAAEFKKAADLDPTHASGYYYNLGAIMVNKGQMDDAAAALKKATDIDPTNANAWYWYGTALMGKATGQARWDNGPSARHDRSLPDLPEAPAQRTQWAPQAQASIDALQGKESLEYKKEEEIILSQDRRPRSSVRNPAAGLFR